MTGPLWQTWHYRAGQGWTPGPVGPERECRKRAGRESRPGRIAAAWRFGRRPEGDAEAARLAAACEGDYAAHRKRSRKGRLARG